MIHLSEIVIQTYPELANTKDLYNGTIILQDDSDNIGAYIAKWEYNQPIPEGLILGKPEVPYVFEPVIDEPVIEPTPEPVEEPVIEEPVVEDTPATTSEPVVEEPVVTEE